MCTAVGNMGLCQCEPWLAPLCSPGSATLVLPAGGIENWVVACKCGTLDDDGERMAACDVCGVWMHTRCQGMSDAQPIPNVFICEKCSQLG